MECNPKDVPTPVVERKKHDSGDDCKIVFVLICCSLVLLLNVFSMLLVGLLVGIILLSVEGRERNDKENPARHAVHLVLKRFGLRAGLPGLDLRVAGIGLTEKGYVLLFLRKVWKRK